MTSPLTGATLTAQRAQGRWKLYQLAVSNPASVYTARINQTFVSLDGVMQIAYDGGSGTYTDVKAGMECWIGSTAGAFDIGRVRVRRMYSTFVQIGRVSNLALADNLYLTFVSDFPLYAKEPVVTDSLTLIDEDLTYDSANSFAGVLKLGPMARILERVAGTVSFTHAAPGWYSPTGATVASYVWTFPGASATADLTTSTPTATYTSAGEYYYSCTVTDSAGASTTAYRKVFVDPSSPAFTVGDISGNVDDGDWSAQIEGLSGCDISTLKDRTLCVLWKRDYVGTALDTQYGPYTGYENVRLIGWIDGDSLTVNPDYGTVTFTLRGPAFWAGRLSCAPMTYSDTPSVGSWNECLDLNTDKALYRLIKWQSTLADICDINFTGSTVEIPRAIVNSGSLWEQISGLLNEKLLARAMFDRYGCMWATIPASLRTAAQKAANEILFDISASDWIEALDIERVVTGETSMIELGGVYWNGGTEQDLYARAPGNTAARFGSSSAPTSTLALSTQAVLNQLSGDVLANENNEYPAVDLTLYWSNDYIDWSIAKGWLVRLSLTSTQTPRGIVWTDKRFVVEAASYQFDVETGAESTQLTLSAETTGAAGVTYFPPDPAQVDEWSIPGAYDLPSLVPPGFTWFPGVTLPPPVTVGDCNSSGANYVTAIFNPSTLTGGTAEVSSYFYYPCKIRDDGSTYIYMEIVTYGDAGDNLTCYAVDAGQNRILTGSIVKPGEGGNTTAYWWLQYTASAGGLDVAGFELVLAAGTGVPVVDGAVTATYNTIGGINSPGLGNTITVNTLTVEQVNVYLVKMFYDVTFVNANGIYNGTLTQNLDITFGVGSPNVRLLHYFNASPVSPNPVYWRVRNIATQYQMSSFYADNLGAGNCGIDLVTNLNNGMVGTYRQIGTLYVSANALIDNTRRAVTKNGILANVCAVG